MTHQVITQLTFNFIREIGGEGANSKAFLAHDPQLDAEIVVKSIPKSDFQMKEDYFNESKMLYSGRHPNIMVINYACEDTDKIYLSMPFHSRGSLNTLMNKRFLSVREIVKYSLDFLSGLHFVHTKKLVHFDIKPTNIIINDSNKAILTDFGLTKYTDANGFASPDKIYMKHYVPDALVTTSLTNQYDIYQAGLTLYRMCNGNDDFNSQCTSLTQKNVMNGTFPSRDKFLPHIPNSLRKSIKKALEVDPDKRYQSVLELMNSISAVSDNLDWLYSINDGKEQWSLEGDKTIKTLSLCEDSGKWKIEGYSHSKKTVRASRITKCFKIHDQKEAAYKQLAKFIKEL
ncbi:UNVERIFIED_CONTAM: serine/threonine protein kinase [Paenibacillus sp. PvR008]